MLKDNSFLNNLGEYCIDELKKIGEIQSVFTNSNNNENSEIICFVSEKFEFNY